MARTKHCAHWTICIPNTREEVAKNPNMFFLSPIGSQKSNSQGEVGLSKKTWWQQCFRQLRLPVWHKIQPVLIVWRVTYHELCVRVWVTLIQTVWWCLGAIPGSTFSFPFGGILVIRVCVVSQTGWYFRLMVRVWVVFQTDGESLGGIPNWWQQLGLYSGLMKRVWVVFQTNDESSGGIPDWWWEFGLSSRLMMRFLVDR